MALKIDFVTLCCVTCFQTVKISAQGGLTKSDITFDPFDIIGEIWLLYVEMNYLQACKILFWNSYFWPKY